MPRNIERLLNNLVTISHTPSCSRSNSIGYALRKQSHTSGRAINSSAFTRRSRLKSPTGIAFGPTPWVNTASPQKGWSPKKGTTVVGHCIRRICQLFRVKLWSELGRKDSGIATTFRLRECGYHTCLTVRAKVWSLPQLMMTLCSEMSVGNLCEYLVHAINRQRQHRALGYLRNVRNADCNRGP